MSKCKTKGCVVQAYAKGLCTRHYRAKLNSDVAHQIALDQYEVWHRNEVSSKFYDSQRKAKTRNIKWELTLGEYERIVRDPCYYCGSINHNFYSGLDRVNNLLGYTKENVVSCCWLCNKMKGELDLSTFLTKICKIVGKYYGSFKFKDPRNRSS